MVFNSSSFLIFFPIVVLVYFVIPGKIRYIWLLIASYYFYMSWNAKYAILIGFSTIITYLSGLCIDWINGSGADNKVKVKKIVVAASFGINILILVVFKYSGFILDSLNVVLRESGIRVLEMPFDIVLPVGISFYTFQALSYTMDVYRGDISAEKNILKYALFVSFFPQLVAGPIERSINLISQINQMPRTKINYERIVNGLIIMVWGFFLKLVIADRIAILVNTVFDRYYMYGTVELVAAAMGFALQIYCDFSSYSTIAIGASQIMGITLMENFNVPYFSRSIKEFWRRWHISLSTWFKDYLYIPLGGNRCSKGRAYLNLMIVFLVSGLWHGANWTFVIWGGVHGLYQIIGQETRCIKDKINKKIQTKTECVSYKLIQMIITFFLVDFAWIFFRADSIGDAAKYIYRIFTKLNLWVLGDGSLYNIGLNQQEIHLLIIAVAILVIVDYIRYKKNQRLDIFLSGQCIWFRWLVIFFLLFSTIIFGVYGPEFDSSQFIYFQF